MINANYALLNKNFTSSKSVKKSELRLASAQILLKGIKEAEYLSFFHDGEEAIEHRRIMVELESIWHDLDLFFDDDGNVHQRHRRELKEAIEISFTLVTKDQRSTYDIVTSIKCFLRQ